MTGIELRTRGIIEGLNPAERKAAAFFLTDINNIFRMPIARLADASGASQVAWVRFCKALGFSGLKDLKRELFIEMSGDAAEADKEQKPESISAGGASKVIDSVLTGVTRVIDETRRLADEKTLEAVAELMLHASSIKLFAVGASSLAAEDLFNKLLRIGVDAVFANDIHLQLTYASNLRPQDAAVFVSHSGSTREVVETLRIARSRGAKTVAITKFGHTPMVMESDHALFVACPEIYQRSGVINSRIAQLIVVDMLYTVITGIDHKRVKPLIENSYNSLRSHKL